MYIINILYIHSYKYTVEYVPIEDFKKEFYMSR